jgi:putative ABC transport system permease protein
MVATVSLGIGVFMAAVTVYYLMSSNPIPHKSDILYAVQLDSWDPAQPFDDDRPEQAPWELTYRDAMALLESDIATRRVAMHKASLIVQPEREGLRPFEEQTRLTGADFFAMFEVPFIYGSTWPPEADENGELLVVLSEPMNDKLYGGEDSVGRRLLLSDREFTVVGVTRAWKPVPKFYDVNNGPFDEPEQMFVPLGVGRELELFSSGNTNCWKNEDLQNYEDFLNSECVWLQFWAELETPDQRDAYQAFVDGYVTGQKALGRFARPLNNRLTPVEEWLQAREVVRDDNKVLLAVAVLFLGVCLFNTVGLLLTKFLGKAPQIGVRRALGASRSAVLRQQLIEVGLLGAVGGIAGLCVAWLALHGIKRLFPGFEHLAELDLTLVGIAIVSAVVSTILAGLYPVWRVCRVPPATYLRLQ